MKTSIIFKVLLLVISLLPVININSQTILTVTKTTDPDPFLFPYDYQDSLCDPIMYGSFQWAIRKANDTPDPCHIVFQIPGTGTHVISLNYFLPPVMNRVFIDGTSQTSYTYSQPSVIIDGSNLIVEGNISSTYFLVFRAGISGPSIDSSCVKGLQVQNFSNSYGITINASYITIKDNIFISTGGEIETPKGMVYFPTLYISAPFNQVKGNIFGTDYTETDSLGSAGGGIFLRQFSKMSAYSCIIGDTLPGDGNIISNNKRYGISLESGDASNRISGNKTYNNDINIYIMSRTIPQPEITGVTQVSGNTIVEGSSVPGYVIELFGSTGGTNANKFYISTIADPQGLWTASIAGFNFPYIVATATDIANNTSGFSNSFEVQPGCNLIVDAGHDTTVTAGSPVALGGNPTASGGMGPYAYAWTPVTGLDDPANANPVATPFFSVNYTLTVSDEFGCTASDEINIRVRPETPLITPGGVFDTILDMYGNKYLLSDLSVSNALSGNNSYQTKSTMLCSPAGYFNLYFEEGSDMEGSGVQEQRREVICQLFRDISAFIASPLETNGLDNHVNIWVRDFNNIPNTGGALGIASPFYCLPAGASTVGGIADNEIWKTIISGFDSYTNVASPILTVGGQSLSFFHGMVAFDFSSFNWHAQLSDNTSHSLYDLYTVALHEVTHSMGFASLIAVDGSSKFAPNYNYYSRYDLFLQTQDGEDLITNTGGCSLYDYAFAGGDLITINPFDCDNAILFGGTVNQLVYSNPPFSNGTSLSHFEDVCHRLGGVDDPKANDSYYVMSDSYNPTFTLMKRIYTPEERNVLCNLGYSVSAIWGSGIAHNYFDYGDNFCVENHVVGINDGINSDGTFRWQVNTGILNIDIPAIQFLENDFVTPPSVTPFGFECLEVIYGSGNVSVSSGSSGDIVHFTVPTIMEPGVRILRYIPISDGIRGNITYLYIWVLDGTCSSSASCNLVNNSNFEDVVYCGNGAVASGLSCWNSISGTVDLFQRGCSGGYNVGTYTHPETQPVESHDGSPNDAFLGFLASQEVTNVKYYEATQTILSSPLIPGEEYKLSFWVRSAHEISWWTDQSNLIYFAATQNLVSGIDCYSPLFSSLPNATRLFDDPIEIPYDPATTYNGWHYREITFPFQGNQPCQNLIIYNDIWDQPTVSGNQYSFYFFLDDVRIESVDNATVSFSPPTTLCLGQEIDLSNFADPPGGEFNGTGVVGTYFSSDIAGVFDVTYTIENNLGCVIEKTEQIQVISIPDIPSFEVSNLCQPQVTFEVQNYDPLLTYQFDFDNTNSLSLPLTSQTIQHNYDAPGYYRVSLVVSNGYCSSHYSEVINIVPHSNSPEYNQEHNPALVLDCQCCSENLSYDFEQEITTGQGSIPLTGIPQITFRKNMKIPDGSIVTITNSTLRFGPQAGIIIEPGGKLVLNNGAVLSGLSDCGGLMWQGIEVQGIRSLAHYYPYPDDDIPHPSQSQQGHLEITGNATISDAHTAIFVGKRRVCIPDMYYGVPFVLCKFIMGNQPPYNNLLFYEPNSGGGILNLNGGEINRCAVGIYITPFPKNNASSIVGVHFNGETVLDPYYNSSNGLTYHYDMQYPNPWISKATPVGGSGLGIYMYKTLLKLPISSINIDNCRVGMTSWDVKYTIENSIFTNLYCGIQAFHTYPSFINLLSIESNRFETIGKYAIQIENGFGTNISLNNFGDNLLNINSDQSVNNIGIYLKNTSKFFVADNTFRAFTLGIHCENSGPDGGTITAKEYREGNTFNYCNRAINTIGSNPALSIHCNTFDNSRYSQLGYLYGGYNWVNSGKGSLAQQGALDVSSDAKLPAGNMFSPDAFRQIKNVGYVPQGIFNAYVFRNYFSHGSPDERQPVTEDFFLHNTQSSSYNPAASCVCSKSLSELKQQITEAEDKLPSLYQEIEMVKLSLDQGRTFELLNAISGNTPVGKLKDKLLDAIPLSDTVLIATLNRSNPLPAGHLRQIVVTNSPVSTPVMIYLDPVADNLPSGIAKQIMEAQTDYTSYRTISGIEAEINMQTNFKLEAQSELLRFYIDSGLIDSAKFVLLNDTSRLARRLLTGIYLIEGDTSAALDQLSLFEPADANESEWKDFAETELSLFSDGRDFFSADSAYIDYLRSMAYRAENELATTFSQSILRLLYGEEFDEESTQSLRITSAQILLPEITEKYDDHFLGDNIPNPFTGVTIIPYQISGDNQDAIIELCDVTGRILMQISAPANRNRVEVSMHNYESGVYYYRLMVNHKCISTKKMVSLKAKQ